MTNTPPIVYVKWLDAAGGEDEACWIPLKNLKIIHPSVCETVGWLLQEEKDYIIVAPTISKFNQPSSTPIEIVEDCCLHPLSIIRANIIDFQIIREGKNETSEA